MHRDITRVNFCQVLAIVSLAVASLAITDECLTLIALVNNVVYNGWGQLAG